MRSTAIQASEKTLDSFHFIFRVTFFVCRMQRVCFKKQHVAREGAKSVHAFSTFRSNRPFVAAEAEPCTGLISQRMLDRITAVFIGVFPLFCFSVITHSQSAFPTIRFHMNLQLTGSTAEQRHRAPGCSSHNDPPDIIGFMSSFPTGEHVNGMIHSAGLPHTHIFILNRS